MDSLSAVPTSAAGRPHDAVSGYAGHVSVEVHDGVSPAAAAALHGPHTAPADPAPVHPVAADRGAGAAAAAGAPDPAPVAAVAVDVAPGGAAPVGAAAPARPEVVTGLRAAVQAGVLAAGRDAVMTFSAQTIAYAAMAAFEKGIEAGDYASAMEASGAALTAFMPASILAGEAICNAAGLESPAARIAVKLGPMALSLGVPAALAAAGAPALGAKLAVAGLWRVMYCVLRDGGNQVCAQPPSLRTVDEKTRGALPAEEQLRHDVERNLAAMPGYLYGSVVAGDNEDQLSAGVRRHVGEDHSGRESTEFLHRAFAEPTVRAVKSAAVEGWDALQAALVRYCLARRNGMDVEYTKQTWRELLDLAKGLERAWQNTPLQAGARFVVSFLAVGAAGLAETAGVASDAMHAVRAQALALTEPRGTLAAYGKKADEKAMDAAGHRALRSGAGGALFGLALGVPIGQPVATAVIFSAAAQIVTEILAELDRAERRRPGGPPEVAAIPFPPGDESEDDEPVGPAAAAIAHPLVPPGAPHGPLPDAGGRRIEPAAAAGGMRGAEAELRHGPRPPELAAFDDRQREDDASER